MDRAEVSIRRTTAKVQSSEEGASRERERDTRKIREELEWIGLGDLFL